MSDKDYQRLMDLADQQLKKRVTKEEAIRSLCNAGILDINGNFTEMYKELATIFPDKEKLSLLSSLSPFCFRLIQVKFTLYV